MCGHSTRLRLSATGGESCGVEGGRQHGEAIGGVAVAGGGHRESYRRKIYSAELGTMIYSAKLGAKIHGVELCHSASRPPPCYSLALKLDVIAYGTETCYLDAAAYDTDP